MEHNRRVAEQLEELRAEAAPELLRTFAEIVQPTIDDLDQYLLAAREAIQLGPEFTTDTTEVIFEDFESGNYDGWEATGDAFGAGPQTQENDRPVSGKCRCSGNVFCELAPENEMVVGVIGTWARSRPPNLRSNRNIFAF